MKYFRNKYVKWTGCAFLLFLCIRYWDAFINIVGLGIHAAMPLLLGAAIAYGVNILMSFFEKHYMKTTKYPILQKCKRPVCMILAYLSFIAIIFFIISMVVPELINCVTSLLKVIPVAIDRIFNVLEDNVELGRYVALLEKELESNLGNYEEKIVQAVNVLISGFGGMLASMVTAVSSAFSALVTLLVAIIFSIYLLLGKEKLASQIKKVFQTYLSRYYDTVSYVIGVLDESFHSFIVGQCTEAVILGALCVLGMWIFQFPYAMMVGVFIGFTALIPVAGAYIGAIVGVIMIMTVSPLKAVLFIVFIVVLQQLEGNLIYPRVVGKSIGLPGIWVLAAITIGGGILGIGGMLLAVPVTATIYKLLGQDIEKKNQQVINKK